MRRLQRPQQRKPHQQKYDRQRQRARAGKDGHPRDGFLQTLGIPCAEGAADGQRQSVIHAERQVGQQAVQRSGRADLRQRGVSQHVACNRRIGNVIDLLKQIAQKQRHRKTHQQSERVSDGHIQQPSRLFLSHNSTSRFSRFGSAL